MTGTPADGCLLQITSLAIDPQGNALMVLFDRELSESTLYKSTDAGESWELANDPDGGAFSHGVIALVNEVGTN